MAFLLKRNASVFCSTVNTGFSASNTVRLNLVDETFSYSQSSSITAARREVLGGTDRSSITYTQAVDPATFSFSTYLTSVSDDASLQADELLWEHFTNTNISGSTIAFTNSDTTQLTPLYLYFQHGNFTYELSEAFISSVSLSMNLEGIPTLTWSGTAKQLNSNVTAPGTYTDHKGDVPNIFGKLTTISMVDDNSTSYTLALTDSTVSINNNVRWADRERIGQVTLPSIHYLGSRDVQGSLQFYLKTGANETSTLVSDILTNLNTNIDRKYNITITYGGAAPNCVLNMPKCTISVPNKNDDEVLVLNTDFIAQKNITSGDEITLTFN